MREQTTVAITITSPALSSDEISARLGLKADRAWASGTRQGLFGVIAKEHGFVIESALGPQASLDNHIKAMLLRISTCAQKIGELGADVEFSCSMQRKISPPLRFEPNDLRWLAAMGARLTVDTLILTEPVKPAAAAKPGP